MLKKTSKIAVVTAKGLGDGLLSLILSHNLELSGYDVTTFCSPLLCELREWFPGKRLLPFPQKGEKLLFDEWIISDHMPLPEGEGHVTILKESAFLRKKSMVENLALLCKERFELPFYGKENGIKAPSSLFHRRHTKRIILHPLGTTPKRIWPMEKYLFLAEELKRLDFSPFFCVSPEEKKELGSLAENPLFPLFPTLSDLAAFVYEADAMIGNNSGIGHLASCLKIPTLSLFARKSYANLWRPGWHKGIVVTPPSLPLGGHLRQKYWKELLSVKRVKKAFLCLYA